MVIPMGSQARLGVMQPILISDRFSLKPLELRDAEQLFRVTDNNRQYLRQWLPWLDSIKRVEDSRAFIRAVQAQSSHNNGTQLAIRLNQKIVGVVGHHQVDWRNRLTSLGYWLSEDYQGRGVVTAACRALVTNAFNDARLNRVEIRCAVSNGKSRAIPERLGFRQEGLLRDAEWLYDHFVDHVVYAMLAGDWTAASSRTNPVSTRVKRR